METHGTALAAAQGARRVTRRAIATLALSSAVACVPVPVEWDGEAARTPGALADSLRLELAPDGALTWHAAWTPATWPTEPAQCLATRRATPALDGEAFASWFSVRPDSSVLLRVARSDDGGATWRAAVTADSMDVGRAGCARPAPYISADSLNAYVHLVYHLDASEGAGIFFTHSMERGAYFHQPVPIVYGDRPSASSVVSRGDTVIVAYEDPNSRSPRVGLALSLSQGHIFEYRLPASDETGEALTPRVAVRGTRLAVAWTASQRGGGVPRTALRYGTLVWQDH